MATKMKCSCNTNTAYGIVNSQTNKLRRLTFSKDLANFIKSKNPNHDIYKIDLLVKEFNGEADNWIYGIVSKKNSSRLLRATVSFEEAKYLTQDDSRIIVECVIRKLQKIEWKKSSERNQKEPNESL